MADHGCLHCNAHSSEPGRCVVCGKHLGNWKRAWIAAELSTLGLALVWILISALTRMQLPALALVFGGLVSFCVTHFSGGRGILFQLLATSFTFAGILGADTIAMILIGHADGYLDVFALSGRDFIDHVVHYLKDDEATALFYVVGVMGGFYIWR